MQVIPIMTDDTYNIYLQRKVLFSDQLLTLISSLAPNRNLIIVTDDNVNRLYAEKLCKHLKKIDKNCKIISFGHGEADKTLNTIEEIAEQLSANNYSRDLCVVGFGGGIATDIAGFIAATFCRGVSLIQIPTTLLAMVDASIGGKNGVNTRYGKNLIGTFYQPKAVIIDITVLQTLDKRALNNGIAEMFKHAAIFSDQYFDFLDENLERILDLDLEVLMTAIIKSCEIKRMIVQEDKYDVGVRNILNYGHTVGHALEMATEHELMHGEAVAYGMIAEAHMAKSLGHLKASDFMRICVAVAKTIHKDFQLTKEMVTICRQYLMNDKKTKNGRPRFVLLERIGKVFVNREEYCGEVPEEIISAALEYIQEERLC